jgi:hypothetical protein
MRRNQQLEQFFVKNNIIYGMKICVVNHCQLNGELSLPPCDVALVSPACLGEVDYESELSGKTEKFEWVARLSKKFCCTLFCACDTDSRGLKRKSVAVADRGKLLGVSDMLHCSAEDNFKSGANLGVYFAGGYKLGVCIQNDLYFPEVINSLSLFGCNLICVTADGIEGQMPPLLIRTYAYLYGVPIVMSVGKQAYFADISGAIASSNQNITLFESCPKNCYKVFSTRRKGLYYAPCDDY